MEDVIIELTLSERMSRHHKYSKKIECRHTGGKKKKNFRLLLELKLKNCRFLKITTLKLPNFLESQLKNGRILLELQLKNCRILQKYK